MRSLAGRKVLPELRGRPRLLSPRTDKACRSPRRAGKGRDLPGEHGKAGRAGGSIGMTRRIVCTHETARKGPRRDGTVQPAGQVANTRSIAGGEELLSEPSRELPTRRSGGNLESGGRETSSLRRGSAERRGKSRAPEARAEALARRKPTPPRLPLLPLLVFFITVPVTVMGAFRSPTLIFSLGPKVSFTARQLRRPKRAPFFIPRRE